MALVPLDSDLSSPRIDYLSSLPNELLDDIFEYAYDNSRPTKPLSKRLLPFFEKQLYRTVSLSSSSLCPDLLLSLSSQPYKGVFVRDLILPDNDNDNDDGFDADFFESILPLLPNLAHLDSPLTKPIPLNNPDQILLFPRLESLAIPVTTHFEDEDVHTDCLDLGQFAYLQGLPRLTSLRLYDWRIYDDDFVEESQALSLPRLQSLRIEGTGAEDNSVNSMTSKCPNLSELGLHCTWTDEIELFRNLTNQPSSLESLSLTMENGWVVHNQESNLASFTGLRHLHLGDDCYSPNIYAALRNLPLLVHLDLGQGEIDFVEFESLVGGSHRLFELRSITLDLDEGDSGPRIGRPSSDNFDADLELQRCSSNMVDWRFPEYNDRRMSVTGASDLIATASSVGVEVKGSFMLALERAMEYSIEENNRAVVASIIARTEESLDCVRQVQSDASESGVDLSDLDVDGLDPARLEIVEIDLPDRDWYVLSLRNKK